MDPASQLPMLLGLAWLTPLASFLAILFFGLVYAWRKGVLQWR